MLRARGWYAEALARADAGNPRGARTAIRAGLRLLDEHRAVLGATDVRAHAAGHRTALAELGLRIALRSGRPREVLEWAERGRATGLLMQRSGRPPDDPETAEAVAALRGTALQIADLRGAGRTDDMGPLLARQAVLERRIRSRSLHHGGAGDPVAPPAGVEALTAALGDAGILELVDADGTLVALTLAGGRVRLHRIGPMRAADDLLDRVAFAVSRLLRPDLPAAQHAAAATLLRDSAARADAALLQRMPELAGRPLVVVPTGSLQNVPWALLPSCAGRPVTVSPSATLWLGARSRPAAPGHTLVAAGPALPGADGEARAVAAVHGVTPMLAADATADRVLRALDGAALVHLAAHGRLAPHNPLFSELTLADGPLFAYDIEQLADAPHTVVLAACESGRSVVCAGDELLGLGAMFLARGTSQLVASPLPVPDAETAPLMTAFHRRLAAGVPVAEALARPRSSCAGGTPDVAVAGFVCVGSGFGRAPVVPAPRTASDPTPVRTSGSSRAGRSTVRCRHHRRNPHHCRAGRAALTSRRPGEGKRRHVAIVVTTSATSQNAASPSHVRSARAPCAHRAAHRPRARCRALRRPAEHLACRMGRRPPDPRRRGEPRAHQRRQPPARCATPRAPVRLPAPAGSAPPGPPLITSLHLWTCTGRLQNYPRSFSDAPHGGAYRRRD